MKNSPIFAEQKKPMSFRLDGVVAGKRAKAAAVKRVGTAVGVTILRTGAVIESLYIKNFALIDELEVSFGSGLNILTGQTGAGKSIIIGALTVVLGERADTEKVRQGANKAVVEAVIRSGGPPDPVVVRLLGDHGVEGFGESAGEAEPEAEHNEPAATGWGAEIILRREIRPAGSRAFINDTPVTVAVLREVGDRLVDLHGQHDHQLLLKQDYHREVIDALPQVLPVKKDYEEAYRQVSRLRKEREALVRREQELNEKMEWHRFQLQELESADLDEEAFSEMEAEMKRLDHAEELDQKAALIAELGSGGERSLMDLFSMIEEALGDMVEIEGEFRTYLEELGTARVSFQELLSHTERYRAGIEFNPERLEALRQKQAEVRRLEKKYGRPLPDLIRYRRELEESVNLAENFDLELGKKEKELNEALASLQEKALRLHEERLQAGMTMSRQISEALIKLGIPNNRFETRVEWRGDENGWIEADGSRVACQADGPDEVVFYISTNRGESPKPLARIASGGEISRVMLAMKSVIAREQQLPVMIFDEIDTGIGGAVAEQVGRTMHDLAGHCQIMAITHQPQIAGQADHHFKVEKRESGDRTVTYIKKLDEEAHIHQIASLMSGTDISAHAVAGAREMVGKARSRRNAG
ncbi:MAG: DNA repair protein RecN [Cyclonatronaceae bacterium]